MSIYITFEYEEDCLESAKKIEHDLGIDDIMIGEGAEKTDDDGNLIGYYNNNMTVTIDEDEYDITSDEVLDCLVAEPINVIIDE